MKKLYVGVPWKNHMLRRSRYEAKRRFLRQFAAGRSESGKLRNQFKSNAAHAIEASLIAPSEFSLTTNSHQVATFFKELSHHIAHGTPVFIDLSSVEILAPDAVLYLVFRFWEYRQRLTLYRIRGNVPRNDKCRLLLLQSGFYRYVRSGYRPSDSDGHILSIRSDQKVRTVVAREVVDFANRHLGREYDERSKAMYTVLIECMANTNNHAFGEGFKRKPYSKWWLVAIYDEDRRTVHFAFLDGGLGIPTTIRKRFVEVLRSIIWNGDADLIKEALSGSFCRSKTGLQYRGKGLPKIRQAHSDGDINDLRVLSNRGLVKGGDMQLNTLDIPFRGTLITWNFVA